jgi:hypothetical protein
MNRLQAIVRRGRPILLGTVLAVAAASAPTLVLAQSAAGYTHEWGCIRGAYERCLDESGKQYNPWHKMAFSGTGVGGYCVKGEAKSGGVIEFACANNVDGVAGKVCTSTETQAYGYSNLGAQIEVGTANTEAGC